MSAQEQTPAPDPDALEASAIAASLSNVAAMLRSELLPRLPPERARSGDESVAILLRMAQRLTPAPDTAPMSGTAAATDAAQRARERVAAEVRVRDAQEAAFRARELRLQERGAAPTQRAFDARDLERYLRQRSGESASLRVTEATPLVGGRSKRTILVSLAGSTTLPAQIVVRQDWASSVTGTSVVSEFDILQGLRSSGVSVPLPFFLEPCAEVLGGPFIVVERLPGRGSGDLFNPARSQRMALQLARQLAQLHRCPIEPFERHGVSTDAYTAEQLDRGLERFRDTHARIGVRSDTVDIAIAWMSQHSECVEGPRALLHNDLGCHNFLIENDDLVAILDWELAQIGNPAADLGYIRGWVGQILPWVRFMVEYRSAGGPGVSELTLDFYTLWCGVRLYCLLLQARAGIASGVIADTEVTYAYAQFLPLLLQRMSRELHAILGRAAEAPASGAQGLRM